MQKRRYYLFGNEAGECWRNCTALRKLLNPRWLKTQVQNQLLWNAHPLFFDICLNSPAVYALEDTLRSIPEDTRNKIKKYLKKILGRDKERFRYRGNWYGFLSEIFVLLKFADKGLKFDY